MIEGGEVGRLWVFCVAGDLSGWCFCSCFGMMGWDGNGSLGLPLM